MSAVDIDDMVLEIARLARMAQERLLARRQAEQLGEAWVGIKTFPLPTVPHRESPNDR